MSRATDRENFIARMAKAGIRPDDSRKLLRYARTLHRLAEAQCNGDWPADNGERKVKECPRCEGLWAPSSFARGVCPDCRTEDLVRRVCAGYANAIVPKFGGDPRGCVLKLRVPGDPGNDFGGEGLVCVP